MVLKILDFKVLVFILFVRIKHNLPPNSLFHEDNYFFHTNHWLFMITQKLVSCGVLLVLEGSTKTPPRLFVLCFGVLQTGSYACKMSWFYGSRISKGLNF